MDENVIVNKKLSTLITADEPSASSELIQLTQRLLDRIVEIAAKRCRGDNYEQRDQFLENIKKQLRHYNWSFVIGTLANRGGGYRAGSIPDPIKGCLQSYTTYNNHCYHAWVMFND